ncbi:hypothetical protein DAPPUDRAFT_118526 [Daphnia pulex]|uniref:Transposable element P transposase-like RNase H domain-containing protein n=1 Tax=Daphnia pulex TaxID=6669 RepID=E9HVV5_DAPPU|nr:hypothetical protein DAPPUDRAFT_118526 [Daphnia pulex]|eukprot:EFX64126.1 hypothetical protein DAPPUDRAFT_118526 [Daphnia pulex]
MKSIKEESTEGDTWSCFMMDQMKNKTKKSKNGYRWDQEVIRQCMLHARSPGAYEYLRKSGMVILPSPKTLRSYLGSSTMEVGVTDIVKEAMRAKIEELGDGLGLHVNIALDEVAIKPNETYARHADKLLGHVDMAGIVKAKNKEKLANKLLTFAMNGLANSFSIIVGYFLVNKMKAEELGAVADNASTNTKMLKLINQDRILSHAIGGCTRSATQKKTSGFMGSKETISFMCKMIKWFEIHDVSNLTQGKYQRLPNKVPFYSSADARLKWVQDFLQWLINWEKSITDKPHFLTVETFTAIVITTKSTIAKISYLLDTAGFKFVLTRKFNSDSLERKFSALRQTNGGNYNMEAKAAIYGVEKLLRTGITYCAINCNVSLAREKQQRANKKFLRATSVKVPKKRALDVLLQLEAEKLAVLGMYDIQALPLQAHTFQALYGTDREHDDNLSTAMTAGFLLLVLEEREICVECKEGLRHINIKDPEADAVNTLNECLGIIKISIMLLIVLNVSDVTLDRGGLNIPSKEFVERMWTIYRFLEGTMKELLNTRKVREDLVTFLVPHITGCATFCCKRGKQLPPSSTHNERLAILVLWKFLSPILNCYLATATDCQMKAPIVSQNKISNRKYNTLT